MYIFIQNCYVDVSNFVVCLFLEQYSGRFRGVGGHNPLNSGKITMRICYDI